MLDQKRFLEALKEFPLYEYAFIDPNELVFTERVRHVCKEECPRYNKSWACPPAVGPVEECALRCRGYAGCLMISTVTEVSDIANIEETLSTRPAHEELTQQIRELLLKECSETYVLSTESCAICEECAWPNGPCRHPDKMFPCVESHGILVTDLAEKRGIDFLLGSNMVVWFSLLFYR